MRKKRKRAGKILKVILYLFIIFVFLFPIYFMLITGLKTGAEIETQTTFYPHKVNMSNFKQMFNGVWLRCLLNSFKICLLSIALCLPLSFLAAYVFSRIEFVGDTHLYFWLITNRMAPAACFVLPFFAIYNNIGLFDTIWGLTLVYTLFNLPLSIWVTMGFMDVIPKELGEAAFLDGYSVWGYFWKVLIPVMRPGLIAVGLFIWMFSWTEMIFASTLTSVKAKTLPVQLLVAVTRLGYGVDWGMAAAGGIVSIIPGVILVFVARKYLIRGFVPLRRF
ncbi:MAG TPA: carbohydrate ABC transporter permease [candidate division WOR-3 bacterium]|uniref:Carbohydrate ABC transporter permease n=1 Tax=candidate division WOR-3 bacterium TaxID=2052148 RepID=A0A7C5DEN1_UNCW3|nr:carbohydrate ABC transporter permease [candidate division WOR-3 bacterium]